MNRLLFWLGLLLCLGVPLALGIHKERQLQGRQLLCLRIAPGESTGILRDDLALRPLDPGWPQEGYLRPTLDSRRVVTAWPSDPSAPPGERIHYRVEDSKVVVASFATPPEFRPEARYAKFELTLEGELLLQGLVDSTLRPLESPSK